MTKYIANCCLIFALLIAVSSCDSNRVFDDNKNIEGADWDYQFKPFFDVYIPDTQYEYNVYVNLRIGSDYKYNNIFMLIHTTNPLQQTQTKRVDIRLANEAGKWTGSGLGDLYDYQFPVYKKIKVRTPGFYRFEVEQNMRDDVLQHVKSTGIRVEKYVAE
jgi:gliding motility-associated lipoprotein GldH